ncbi:MAG TPA: exonuclease domain-containing protein [Candidatus Sulfotelmatobacter sp.]|jgi:DNA polymerase-3 subunit epsilon|nr:exonuclease domain-containing protein [Candidatus Sulfotelmatobacter sp.]
MNRRLAPFLLLCLAFAAYAGALAGAAFLLPLDAQGNSRAPLLTFAVLAVGLAGGLGLVSWKIVDLIVLRAARKLAVELRAISHGEVRDSFDLSRYSVLPVLPEAANEMARKLGVARRQVNEAVAAATANAEAQKARLAAILNDLHEGVVVCNMKHQVVLYNQVALHLLHVSGEMGLGRNLFGLVAKEPVLHILDILLHRPEGELSNAPFVSGTIDGRSLLQGRMSLVRTQGEITGYVITFNDVTDQVAALAKRDTLLREVLDGMRNRLDRLSKSASNTETVIADLSDALGKASKSYRSLVTGWWPMSDIHSADLFDFVIRRLENSGLKVTMTGLPIWLHGDSHSLVLALEALIRAIAKAGPQDFDLAAEPEDGHAWVNIAWDGGRVDDETLIAWQKAPVSAALGGMTVRDVMAHHTREDLVEEAHDGRVTLRIPLSLGHEGQDKVTQAEKLPPRPEFFDFNLLAQGGGLGGDLGGVKLRDLTYVVFDTETTGLNPGQGDQIVSIAGVRIVGGRILTGESFNRIVNPGRAIPPESTKFHGLTDEMVADKPPIAVVLPQFKAYAADAVLIAHNAAFDLKFIRLRERECGVSFDNPVLDTMLLSSYVDGSAEGQSLDDIAERYGVTVTDRHTALGDSLVTAAVLLRLIEALEARGIHTLDEALTTLNMTMELHNRSLAFG